MGGRPRDAAGHAQVSRQAKHYAHKGINALMSCDKAFQNPCHSKKNRHSESYLNARNIMAIELQRKLYPLDHDPLH